MHAEVDESPATPEYPIRLEEDGHDVVDVRVQVCAYDGGETRVRERQCDGAGPYKQRKSSALRDAELIARKIDAYDGPAGRGNRLVM